MSLLFGDEYWLINTQMGFIPSAFVMFGSMLSYRSMVQGRLRVGAIPDDERDTLDTLEDPYDLYDEERKKDDSKKAVEKDTIYIKDHNFETGIKITYNNTGGGRDIIYRDSTNT